MDVVNAVCLIIALVPLKFLPSPSSPGRQGKQALAFFPFSWKSLPTFPATRSTLAFVPEPHRKQALLHASLPAMTYRPPCFPSVLFLQSRQHIASKAVAPHFNRLLPILLLANHRTTHPKGVYSFQVSAGVRKKGTNSRAASWGSLRSSWV